MESVKCGKILTLKLLLVMFHISGLGALGRDPVVEVQQGLVRGTIMQSTTGRPFYAFRGVAYAKPPLGQLRFKPPLPAEPWTGTFNATQDSPMCAQMNLWTNNITYEEDCLTLNVYTPKVSHNGTELLPVMFYIHEGAFVSGESSSTNKPPQRLMNKDIVLVTIQYRLGLLGFLSTGDEQCPGNFGLLDQVLALKWVQQNIESFGGDPSQVTISGQSAGGASVTFHLISPLSRGLFRGAIAQSGTALAGWAIQPDPLPQANRFGEEVQCDVSNTTVLIQCLRAKSVEDIIQGSINLDVYNIDLLPYKPVVDRAAGGHFLPDSPLNLFSKGVFTNVSVIIGATKDEAAGLFYGNVSDFDVIDDKFFEEILPRNLAVWTHYEGEMSKLSHAVKSAYFDVIDVSNRSQVIRTIIDLVTDIAYKAPNVLTAKFLAKYQVPVYMYSFEYAGNTSSLNFSGEREIGHEDDLYYLFNRTNLNKKDQQLSDIMVTMWANFVADLNPSSEDLTFQWTPTAARDPLSYFHIGDDIIEMRSGYLTERMNFWNEIAPTLVSQ